ncbi:MAG: hypothetical protein AB7R89_10960 [Dehalococcoidia bacterium]
MVSSRFPFIPIELAIDGHSYALDAMLDTGFDGDVVVPADLLGSEVLASDQLRVRLADGSGMVLPAHFGTARIGEWEIADVMVYVLGDVPLVGTNRIRHFIVTLDHGRRVIVEP